MALAHCILGKFLGVGCHCFPPKKIVYCSFYFNLKIVRFFCRTLYIRRCLSNWQHSTNFWLRPFTLWLVTARPFGTVKWRIRGFFIDSSPLCVYSDLGYLVLFQSKHSCFWCSLVSVSIRQHVSTLLFLGHHQISPFFVCGRFSTFCNATYSRCLFYIWLKYIHMAKILVIILQYSYVVRYLFYLWLGFWYNTIETLW